MICNFARKGNHLRKILCLVAYLSATPYFWLFLDTFILEGFKSHSRNMNKNIELLKSLNWWVK